jgi:DNA-binding MarR family transcriptional regulator
MEITEVEQRILKALMTKDKMLARELVEKSRASTSVLNPSLKHLEELGLVKEEREEDFPRRRFIMLTDKGRKVGELLYEIEKTTSQSSLSNS